MKFIDNGILSDYDTVSLPVRGAWIEIPAVLYAAQRVHVSLPVRGAWIEMSTPVIACIPRRCRSPCGERGLK